MYEKDGPFISFYAWIHTRMMNNIPCLQQMLNESLLHTNTKDKSERNNTQNPQRKFIAVCIFPYDSGFKNAICYPFLHFVYIHSLSLFAVFAYINITVYWQIKFISLHSQGYIPLYFLNRGNHLFSIFPHDSSAIYLSHNLPNTSILLQYLFTLLHLYRTVLFILVLKFTK